MVEQLTEAKREEVLHTSTIPIIILAGGRGQRLGEVTQDTSKLLAETSNGQTLLDLTVGVLRGAGARNIIISVAHKKEQVIAHCQNYLNHLGLKISDQGTPVGIPDALLKAIRQYQISNDFIACDGDGIRFGLDLAALMKTHTASNALATLAVAAVDNPSRHYAVRLDSLDRITGFIKFPETEGPIVVHTGLILFGADALPLLEKPREDKAWDGIYEDLLASGRLYGHVMPGVDYFNVNTPEALSRLNDYLVGRE